VFPSYLLFHNIPLPPLTPFYIPSSIRPRRSRGFCRPTTPLDGCCPISFFVIQSIMDWAAEASIRARCSASKLGTASLFPDPMILFPTYEPPPPLQRLFRSYWVWRRDLLYSWRVHHRDRMRSWANPLPMTEPSCAYAFRPWWGSSLPPFFIHT